MADDAASQLAALKKARASGVLTVHHGDTSTTFRTLAEIDSIVRSLEAEAEAASSPRPRLRYAVQLTKGL
jgi:hypothetical protein